MQPVIGLARSSTRLSRRVCSVLACLALGVNRRMLFGRVSVGTFMQEEDPIVAAEDIAGARTDKRARRKVYDSGFKLHGDTSSRSGRNWVFVSVCRPDLPIRARLKAHRTHTHRTSLDRRPPATPMGTSACAAVI